MCFWRYCKAFVLKCWPKRDSDDSFVSFDVDGVNVQVQIGNGNEERVNPNPDESRAFRIRRALRSMVSPQMNEAISDDEQMVLEVHEDGANNDDQNDDDRDRLFEEYINNGSQSTSHTQNYNTDLPTEHTYLGKLERVEGVDFLEPGQVYRIPICGHHSIVYPGEKIPLILSTSFLSQDHSDGIKIGLVFWDQSTENKFFGVTCQVYEKTLRNSAAILKTTAQQRFLLVKQSSGSYTSTYSRDGRIGYYADVKILPEITLPDPLISFCSNNQAKFSISTSTKQCNKFKNFISRSTIWPKFVYDQYGMEDVMQKVNRFLAFLKITAVPEDPVKLSFWLARNIPIISEEDRASIFYANSVIDRMLIINKSLDYMCYFCCKHCELKIGNYNEIFAMSKEGVQAAYCNPSGYVHETLTIYNTISNSTYVVDRPSTEFSWFPGYSWQVTLCNGCHCHLGWKFVATKKNYLPKSFYGLSGKSISVKSVKTKKRIITESGGEETNEDDDDDDDNENENEEDDDTREMRENNAENSERI